jgi:predicted nucleotidyltransferase
MFTVEHRDRARRLLLERAHSDPRIVAAAVVGSEASGRVDRWSDLDLTFGVSDDASLEEVLAEWTRAVDAELDAPDLFDVHVGPTVYRVFLLPGNLQVDLSFTPAARFGPLGPDFRLPFGTAVEDACASR